MEKVVLAYSGGLDTSFCVKWLQEEKNLEVHCVLVQTGGFSEAELKSVEERAFFLGAKSFKVLDVTQKFYDDCVKYLIFGNVLRNNTYPLSVSAERSFQALAVVDYTVKIGAKKIAHGSTGAGNDQVRFDLIFDTLGNEIDVITPIRDLTISREDEVNYLKKYGVNLSWEKSKYSINQGVWGTSVGGAETLTSDKYLPEEAWPTPISRNDKQTINLEFVKGELIGVGNKLFDNPLDAIIELQSVAAPFGIGRDIHVGDTIIGLKGRVGFEAAAPIIILKAHHLLEKHNMTKWEMYWKEQLANWYGMFLHEGQFLDPVMRHIEQFLISSQARITGKVIVELSPERFTCQGVQSGFDLMDNDFGKYGEYNAMWSGDDVKGFTKILGNAHKIFQSKIKP